MVPEPSLSKYWMSTYLFFTYLLLTYLFLTYLFLTLTHLFLSEMNVIVLKGTINLGFVKLSASIVKNTEVHVLENPYLGHHRLPWIGLVPCGESKDRCIWSLDGDFHLATGVVGVGDVIVRQVLVRGTVNETNALSSNDWLS